MIAELNIAKKDRISRKTVMELYCRILAHEGVKHDKDKIPFIVSGRYRIIFGETGLMFGNIQAPGLVFYYISYDDIIRTGVEEMEGGRVDYGLVIELDDDTTIVFPDESTVNIAQSVIDEQEAWMSSTVNYGHYEEGYDGEEIE